MSSSINSRMVQEAAYQAESPISVKAQIGLIKAQEASDFEKRVSDEYEGFLKTLITTLVLGILAAACFYLMHDCKYLVLPGTFLAFGFLLGIRITNDIKKRYNDLKDSSTRFYTQLDESISRRYGHLLTHKSG